MIQSTPLKPFDESSSDTPLIKVRKLGKHPSKLIQPQTLDGRIKDRFAENSVVNEIEPWKEEDGDGNSSDGGFDKHKQDALVSEATSPLLRQTPLLRQSPIKEKRKTAVPVQKSPTRPDEYGEEDDENEKPKGGN